MSLLFEPYRLGPVVLRNRFIRSATTSYWSDEEGNIRPEIVSLYSKLAEGGAGLIIKGHLYVTNAGKAHTGMAGISEDHHLHGLKRLTEAVHKQESSIVAQLNHAGLHSVVDRAGPSEYVEQGWKARALSGDEIGGIVEAFGDAAENAMVAGFDGVQVHGAHGYLVSQFLSSLTNRRTDEWGGSLEKRMRFLIAVYDEIRRRVGLNTPVLLKLNCDDFSPDGFTVEDSAKVAQTISHRGIDCIEVSGGGVGRRSELVARAASIDPELKEATFSGYAMRIREATRPTPLALVNGIRTRRCMDAIVRESTADLISMSRPFIKEPDLVKRLEAGQQAATCKTCSACSSEKVFGKMMLHCHSQ
jgi:2,4-dienoyl-CoA reductase-like NADH-dependent reductase (Old Yellow Enzyme family)